MLSYFSFCLVNSTPFEVTSHISQPSMYASGLIISEHRRIFSILVLREGWREIFIQALSLY